MALARVQGSGKATATGATSVSVSFSATPTVGNGVVVGVFGSWWGFAAGQCTDNQGNTYELAFAQGNGVVPGACAVFWCPLITTASGTFTVTVNTGASANYTVVAMEVSGVGAGLTVANSSSANGIGTTNNRNTTNATGADWFEVMALHVAASQASITKSSGTPSWTEEAEDLSVAGEVNSRIRNSGTATTESWTWTSSGWHAVGLVAFVATPSIAPFVRVSTTTATNWTGSAVGTTWAAPAFAAVAGNLIVVAVGANCGTTDATSVTDTAGNTYTKVDDVDATAFSDTYHEEIWYAKNVAAHAANVVTVTWPSSVTYPGIIAVQYSGASATAPYVTTAKGAAASGSGAATTGSLTTGSGDELHVLIPRWGWGAAITWPAGFEAVPETDAQIDFAHKKVTGPYSGTYSITHTTAGGKFALAAVFTAGPSTVAHAETFIILPV